MKYIILLFLTFCYTLSSAQNYADSLIKVIETMPEDTAKANRYNSLSLALIKSDTAKFFHYSNKATELSEKLNFDFGLAEANRYKGLLAYYNNQYSKSLKYYKLARPIIDNLGDERRVGTLANNFGNSYWYAGQYKEAIEEFLKALKLFEKIGEKKGIAVIYNNIGGIYLSEENYKMALEYMLKSLEVKKELGITSSYYFTLSNVGNAYMSVNMIDSAESKYLECLRYFREQKDSASLALMKQNLGATYMEKGDYARAKYFLFQAITALDSMKDYNTLTEAYNNLGITLTRNNEFKPALETFKKAEQIALDNNYKERLKFTYKGMVELFTKMGDFKSALMYKDFQMQIKDSLLSEKNNEIIARLKEQFESDKKDSEIDLLSTKSAIQEAEIKKQQVIEIALAAGAVLFIIMLFLLFNRYKIKQRANAELNLKNTALTKANEIITQSRDEIASKNKEITAGITYAKRIQQAVLPKEEVLKKSFKEHFILYQPKDIVSGDFYWHTEIVLPRVGGFRGTFLALADCTGHGVPGAFMSLIGNEILNNLIKEKGIYQPGTILMHLNNAVKNSLKQNNEDESADGMEIALIAIDRSKNELHYAGAKRPLFIVRGGKIFEVKASQFAIGGTTPENQVYTNNVLELQAGDKLYLFSDGYTTQLSSAEMKKYSVARLKDKILAISPLAMNLQNQALQDEFNAWKGDMETLDDVLVIGVTV